jgi:thiol-disulfide isomerase/thioredoxin
VSPGILVLLVALLVAAAVGVTWRLTNGRMRAIPVQAVAEPGALRAAAGSPAEAGQLVSAAELGKPLGDRATLLQFSSAFCAPCRATRQILGEVAGMTSGVAHIEIDAESRLDLVRELHVLRTPTVLVLDADGRVTRRASGRPTKADVLAAVGAAVGSE